MKASSVTQARPVNKPPMRMAFSPISGTASALCTDCTPRSVAALPPSQLASAGGPSAATCASCRPPPSQGLINLMYGYMAPRLLSPLIRFVAAVRPRTADQSQPPGQALDSSSLPKKLGTRGDATEPRCNVTCDSTCEVILGNRSHPWTLGSTAVSVFLVRGAFLCPVLYFNSAS